jgi:ABC-2 type transport system ATP-binding protein
MSKNSQSEPALTVSSVYKNFALPRERNTSIKSAIVNIFDKRDKEIDIQHALRDISFEVKKGEFFGIVGRNGSGKSTLLKILAQIYQPTSGEVESHGKLVPFIELGVGFNPELTGRENVFLNGALLGFSRKEIKDRYDDIVKFAELEDFMDQKLKNYSSGMQVRLAFSVATRSEADILLVDEVLAVGDADFQRKCFQYFRKLKKDKKTVVFVSHDMGAVKEYCDRAILIEKSKIIKSGKVNEVASAYTKLFIPEDEVQGDLGIETKRWGDGKIKYTNINLSKTHLTDKDKELILTVEYETSEDITDPVFGFSLKNSGGTALFGTNTRLQDKKVTHIKNSTHGKIIWSMSNILNDGDYLIDVALSNSDETTQYDWWEDALEFTVYREQHTTYVVEPPISVEIHTK